MAKEQPVRVDRSNLPESNRSTSRRRVLLAGVAIAALPLAVVAAAGTSNQPSITDKEPEP
jgi:hypothetical protein